ncbi:MAG TPA: signal recognition particle protein [Nitrospiria bacterium]
MLDRLSTKLESILKKLKGRGVLNEKDVDSALKEVRFALLEADVHFKVVKDFLASVREKALGKDVLDSLTPGQQVVKVVRDELGRVMGEEPGRGKIIPFASNPPTVLMLAGLQGAGKTTTAAKLAQYFKSQGRRVLLAAGDARRPAAVEQLVNLGGRIGVETQTEPSGDAVGICREAVARARTAGHDLVILDTAGRLHVDEALMEELRTVKDQTQPHEILLVGDAMTGQDAVAMARTFHETLGLTGIILSKLDGDARGGAVLSMRAVTGVPVKFVGVGEKIDALEPFHPERMASRLLGMGDVMTLIEKAETVARPEEAAADLEALVESGGNAGFSLEDFQKQIGRIKKLGSMEGLMGLIPGANRIFRGGVSGDQADREMVRVEAMINSMTPGERKQPGIINGSRRKRIARGSGTSVQDVNKLLKNFLQTKKMLKSLSRSKGRGGIRQLLGSM